MKRFVIGLILCVLLFAQKDTYTSIRTINTGTGTNPIYVEKFDDGPNTCYVAHTPMNAADVFYTRGLQAITMSCVKR